MLLRFGSPAGLPRTLWPEAFHECGDCIEPLLRRLVVDMVIRAFYRYEARIGQPLFDRPLPQRRQRAMHVTDRFGTSRVLKIVNYADRSERGRTRIAGLTDVKLLFTLAGNGHL